MKINSQLSNPHEGQPALLSRRRPRSLCRLATMLRRLGLIQVRNSYRIGLPHERAWAVRWSEQIFTRPEEHFLTKNAINQSKSYQKIEIPTDKLQIRYAKSSGPGGQAVNKRSTKVEVRINLKTCNWIPDDVKAELVKFDTAQTNQEGDFIVTSQRHRSRDDNQRDCISKLKQFIRDAQAKANGELTKDEKFYQKILRNRARAERRRRAKSGDQDKMEDSELKSTVEQNQPEATGEIKKIEANTHVS